MGVGIDMYMQEGINMDIHLLDDLINKAQANDEYLESEYVRGLIDARDAIIHQKNTFPWD